MIEVIEVFIRELPILLNKIATAWERENLDALESCVRELKGAGSSAGFTALANHAANIERLIRSSQINMLKNALENLTQVSEKILVSYSD